jgi:concanavalin A-like lectin/glucanase superfamily protein
VALWSRPLAASEVTQLFNPAGNATSYWTLDEASGTRNDSVGTNNLTDNNTVTQAAGKIGNAAQFTAASSEWLSVADNSSLGFTTAMSASLWIRQDSLALDRAFLGKWAYQTDGGWAIQSGNASGNSGDISIYLATSATDDGTSCRMDFNDADMSASTWYHVLVVYDGTLTGNASRLKVWVNGVPKTLTVGAGAVPSTLRNDTAALNVGKFGGTWTRYLDGRMDEVRLWGRALSAAEATQVYNAGNGLTYPPADTIPPTITLTEPTNAVLQ